MTAVMTAARSVRLLVVTLVVVGLMGISQLSEPAIAAAPRSIVVEGPLLGGAVLLDDWEENFELIAAIETAREHRSSQVAVDPSRPRLDLLYYWLNSVSAEASAAKLGSPQARVPFWPATADQNALIGGYSAPDTALEILGRHGIPTHIGLGAAATEESSPSPAFALVGVALVLAAAAGALIWRRHPLSR